MVECAPEAGVWACWDGGLESVGDGRWMGGFEGMNLAATEDGFYGETDAELKSLGEEG